MNPTTHSDKRQFSRILFDAPVDLSASDRHWHTNLIDISLKGALIKRPPDWPDDAAGDFELHVKLDGGDGLIKMQVRIAHEHPDMIGFKCVQIDLDSVTCLRRLVELNLSDNTLLERELDHLAHA
ncbi:MAG: PilZ domain-containing protein [Thiotrichales bacterium]|nr:PilZ domain-containing protein [Thiotrichales bacterium]